ncbi:MAG: ATP-binding protein [Thermodesulfobacteriota bacterium]
MLNRKTLIAVLLIFAAAYTAFVAAFERASRREAERNVSEHAKIVANALWNYNRQSVAEYLALACKANDYESLTVTDTAGEVFQEAGAAPAAPLEEFLARIGLVGRTRIAREIPYEGQKIGVIEVVWRSRAVYTEAVVLAVLLLVLVIFIMGARLVRARRVLEEKVRERTAELSGANASLLKEIADRIEAEKAMRQSEEKYRTLVDNLGMGISLLSPEMKVIAVNRQMKRWFPSVDETEQPVCFRAFNDPPEDRPCVSCPTVITLKDGQRHEAVSETLRGGEKRHYRIISTPIKDPAGNVLFAIEILEDITDRKAAEAEKNRLFERLQQAQKMEAIGTLAGGIAHDFNNLLFPIIGYTEMLLLKKPEPEVVFEKLGEVLSAAQRARELVHQILTIARQNQETAQVVNLRRIVEEVAKLARATIPTTIEIRLSLAGKNLMAFADSTQIHQIVLNLCTNAFHAMREKGGILEIALSEKEIGPEDSGGLPQGTYALLSVSDTGCGIQPEVADRIFEPYFTTKEAGQGTGLGLSVVHGIVAKLGGDIRMKSEPGLGSTFEVLIPTVASGKEQAPVRAEGPLATGNESVLLVDDQPDVLKMIREMLEAIGYRVTALNSSRDALEVFRKASENFDVVITDMAMPGMAGNELAAKIMEIRPGIPLILCTGYSDSVDAEKAGRMGFAAYLIKPVAMRRMAETLADVLAGR